MPKQCCPAASKNMEHDGADTREHHKKKKRRREKSREDSSVRPDDEATGTEVPEPPATAQDFELPRTPGRGEFELLQAVNNVCNSVVHVIVCLN